MGLKMIWQKEPKCYGRVEKEDVPRSIVLNVVCNNENRLCVARSSTDDNVIFCTLVSTAAKIVGGDIGKLNDIVEKIKNLKIRYTRIVFYNDDRIFLLSIVRDNIDDISPVWMTMMAGSKKPSESERRLLSALGLIPLLVKHGRTVSDEEEKTIIELYQKGYKITEIAKIVGRPTSTIYSVIKKRLLQR